MNILKTSFFAISGAIVLASCGGSVAPVVSTPIANIDAIPLKTAPLNDVQYKNWGAADLITDTIPGMSVDKAYAEIIKKQKGETVIVGVIDSGVDIEHEDLKNVIWTNEDEIPNNGKDDDNNGYVDDVHGWNFLGNIVGENMEYVRIVKKLNPKFDGKSESAISAADREEYDLYKKAMAGVYVLGEGQNNIKDEVDIRFYSTESELLKEFLRYWIKVQPTCITGWNTNGFDIPYLYNRLSKVLGEEFANALSPIQIVKYNPNKKMYRIAGISSLDYMDLYRKFTYTQQSSYRLDHIGTIEVGLGKVEYEGTLDDLYRDDIDKFIEYNLNDVEIVKALDQKFKLLDLARAVSHLGRIPYEEVY
ncbi:MAG: hypothetical protein CMC15_11575, partial [Flavobacteriaceae bacterium]|nr:hypothetical protein [Flavobacteriaceae bacterium]